MSLRLESSLTALQSHVKLQSLATDCRAQLWSWFENFRFGSWL